MGGYCALALARRAPERILGLALVASRPTPTRSNAAGSARS
jgi:pimeloyl-ACP methyl ester carboxylesterase